MARLIDPEQTDQVAVALAEAFFDDPMFTYILPDPTLRLEPLIWFFKSGIRYGRTQGEVYTNNQGEGGAIWLLPGQTAVTFTGMLRAGMLAAPVKLGWSAFGRFLTLTNTTEVIHKRIIATPHYYLMALGVDPERQQRGIGSDLIQPVLIRADREGIPCYLETEREANLAFYRRHGFRIVFNGAVAHDGPPFWALMREPQKSYSDNDQNTHLIEGSYHA